MHKRNTKDVSIVDGYIRGLGGMYVCTAEKNILKKSSNQTWGVK
jgi:hypothetical protein